MEERQDLISRQAAIDAVSDCGICIQRIVELPSAQPYTDEEIRRIQELEQAQFEKMYELGYQEGRVAQPERQKGEWIDYTEDGYVECSFCHNATNCDGNKDELHFCFSCGADMREDDYEID